MLQIRERSTARHHDKAFQARRSCHLLDQSFSHESTDDLKPEPREVTENPQKKLTHIGCRLNKLCSVLYACGICHPSSLVVGMRVHKHQEVSAAGGDRKRSEERPLRFPDFCYH
jgi:hypothetical protein